MLRSPLAALKRRRLHTAGVVVVMAVSMWMGAALVVGLQQLGATTEGAFQQFVPAVYLHQDVDDTRSAALQGEIQDWSGIATVEVESPEETFDRLEQQFGESELREMALDGQMMPTRLLVHPRVWQPDRVELLARIEALEEREGVVAVDVPSTEVFDWMQRGRIVVATGGAVVVLGLLGAVAALALLLRSIEWRRRRENYLLEMFGASDLSLRTPSLWRGGVVGGTAGVVAALMFVPWSLVLSDFTADIAGENVFSAVQSALWAGGLVAAGAAIGAAVGWFAASPSGPRDDERMEPLIRWSGE